MTKLSIESRRKLLLGAAILSAVCVGPIVIATTSFVAAAKADSLSCQSIGDPMEQFACHNKETGKTAGASKRTKAASSEESPIHIPIAYVSSQATEPKNRLWFEAGMGAFWVSGGKTSPLTISGFPGSQSSTLIENIPPPFISVLTSQNIANTLISNNATAFQEAEPGWRPGESFRFGYWLNDQRTQGLDVGGQLVDFGQAGVTSPSGGATVAAPFFGGFGTLVVWQPLTATTRAVYVNTTPGVFVHLWSGVTTSTGDGSASGSSSIDAFTADANYRFRFTQSVARAQAVGLATHKAVPVESGGPIFDLLFGLRYANVSSALSRTANINGTIIESVTLDPVLGLPNSANFVNSSVAAGSAGYKLSADNNFVGPQVGASGAYHWGRFWISGDAKVALGATFESINLATSGYVTTTTSKTPTNTIYPAAGISLNVTSGPPVVTTTTAAAGALLQRSNLGGGSKTVLAALPSAALTAGYEIVPNSVSLTLGYSAYYLSNAALAAPQAGSQGVKQSGFWAQGITFGVEAQF